MNIYLQVFVLCVKMGVLLYNKRMTKALTPMTVTLKRQT